MLREVRWSQTTLHFRKKLVKNHQIFKTLNECFQIMLQVEQWICSANEDKPPCPFNQRTRTHQTCQKIMPAGLSFASVNTFEWEKKSLRWRSLNMPPTASSAYVGNDDTASNTMEEFTPPADSTSSGYDLESWSWSSRCPEETFDRIWGTASIRMQPFVHLIFCCEILLFTLHF